MDPQRFKSICAEFKALSHAWKAATDYNEKQRIITKAKATLMEARKLTEQAKSEIKEKGYLTVRARCESKRKVGR